MGGWWWSIALGSLLVGGCRASEGVARPGVSPVASGAAQPAPNAAVHIETKGYIGDHRFHIVCTAAAGATLVETQEATTLSCHDTEARVGLTIRIVSPKVGTMDASPNRGASLITLDAGERGHCDNTDGRCNAGLVITQWDVAPGHRVGNFGMNWHDSDNPPRKEGEIEGQFSF